MRAIMDKLWVYNKIYIKYHLTYKANIMLKVIHIPINLFVIGMMWIILGKNNRNLDVNYLIKYYFLTFLITTSFPFAKIVRDIEDDIFNGKVTTYLIRPISYFIPKFINFISWITIYFLLSSPAVIFILLSSRLKIVNLLWFLLILLMGLIIQFLFWYLTSLISFWYEKILGIIRAVFVLQTICSGVLIPLHMFNYNLQKIINFLPFKYYVYYPINVFLISSNYNEICKIVISELVWILILSALITYVWNLGLAKYQNNFN
ncbi:MAG: ABC-2 family transporter protein [bacterium]|nr:ABC-2 family transporter protein [bacterium]